MIILLPCTKIKKKQNKDNGFMSKNEWTELVTIVEQNIIIYEHFILNKLYFLC